MHLPSSLIQSLQGISGFHEQAFINAHQASQQITSIRLNPVKSHNLLSFFQEKNIQCEPVPWADNGYYLSERPSFTFDPLFHAGSYYVQEASSMFLEQALKQLVDLTKPLRVLDLCAAPGGKSTHLQSIISKESLLVSNEVIRQRANILKDNTIKWGSSNVIVTNNNPKDFLKLKGFFDVIVVDAPCSGSGLFRRDADAIDEWSENNVMLCSQRQQRIVADILPALKENGLLVYATCSFSCEEDEQIVDWITSAHDVSNVRLQLQSSWNITEVTTQRNNVGYRFWPHLAKGEGFFMATFRNNQTGISTPKNKTATKPATKNLHTIASQWAAIDGFELLRVNNKIYAWHHSLFNDFDWILQNLRVIYSGTLLGELMHQKMIPDHALAMSKYCNNHIPKIHVHLDEAIAYLQKGSFYIDTKTKGWHLVAYANFCLGWANVLPNRINNYYPKEFRILKTKF